MTTHKNGNSSKNKTNNNSSNNLTLSSRVCLCVLVLTIKKLLKYSACQRTITTQLFQQVAAMLNGVLGPGRRMPQATQGKGATREIWGTYKWASVYVCISFI